MKTIKIQKRDYKDLAGLLKRVGAVNVDCTQAYPSHVYFTKHDLKIVEKEITKEFKKHYPYIVDKKLRAAVGMPLLNLAPNAIEGTGLKNGYMLVDNHAITRE